MPEIAALILIMLFLLVAVALVIAGCAVIIFGDGFPGIKMVGIGIIAACALIFMLKWVDYAKSRVAYYPTKVYVIEKEINSDGTIEYYVTIDSEKKRVDGNLIDVFPGQLDGKQLAYAKVGPRWHYGIYVQTIYDKFALVNIEK